jgi:hypothetical protein
LVASRLANRIGLVNTMVVTHLPSNVLLMLIPLMPTLPLATLMLLLRFSISQMDVPTRQSYTMAVVVPAERAAASGITGVARTTGAALSPLFAGLLFARPSLVNVPFYIAGLLKIAYDLWLFHAFRSLKPPEEVARTGGIVLLVLAAATSGFAQDGPPSLRAGSLSTKIVVDGQLTEIAWGSADTIEDFRAPGCGSTSLLICRCLVTSSTTPTANLWGRTRDCAGRSVRSRISSSSTTTMCDRSSIGGGWIPISCS